MSVSLLLVGLVFSLAGKLIASDAPKMFATRIEIPERGEVSAYLFVVGTNKFTFMNPEGWKAEGKVDRREIVFIAPDLEASLTLRIIDDPTAPDLEKTREGLAERFPAGKLVHEFRCHGANRIGWGFELEQPAAEKSLVKIRYGVLPLPGGRAELTLRGPTGRMDDLRLVFGRFLASFYAEAHKPRG
jgi:hypothetical protein